MRFCQVDGNARRESRRDDSRDLLDAGGPQLRDAAEPPQELLRRSRAHAGNVFQAGLNRAPRPALAMKSYREAVSFVADLLNQMQDWRMALQVDRLVLLPEHIDNFLLLGDAGDSLVDDLKFFQRRGGRVELAEAPIDQDQVGEGFLFFLEAAITALNDFLHAREIVIAPFATNDELAIAGFFHPPIFPHNHRSNSVGALQMGDIEALDAARRLRQPERLLERVNNCLRAGLQDAEALLEGVARVLFNQLQEGVLRAPLRHQNFDAAARRLEIRRPLSENVLEDRAANLEPPRSRVEIL